MEATTSPERRHHCWRWVLVGVVGAALVVLVAGLAFVLWPRSPSPITEDDALAAFRRSPGTGATGGSGPAAGVYTYDVDGTESIEMGPLPLPTRSIPETVTVVVTPDGACWTLDLNLMEEHTERTRLCRGDDGALLLPSQTKAEKVPGFDVGVTNTCDPAVVLSPTGATAPMACHETFDVSGLTLVVDFEGTATAEPAPAATVDGRTVDVVHLHLDLRGTGDLSGHWIEDWWLTAEGLPVRMDRDIDLDGPGHFVERSTLTLRSLDPRT